MLLFLITLKPSTAGGPRPALRQAQRNGKTHGDDTAAAAGSRLPGKATSRAGVVKETTRSGWHQGRTAPAQ
jgi:hypothetical protein